MAREQESSAKERSSSPDPNRNLHAEAHCPLPAETVGVDSQSHVRLGSVPFDANSRHLVLLLPRLDVGSLSHVHLDSIEDTVTLTRFFYFLSSTLVARATSIRY